MSRKALINLELACRYVLTFKYVSYHHKKQTGGSHTDSQRWGYGLILASGFGRIRHLQGSSTPFVN